MNQSNSGTHLLRPARCLPSELLERMEPLLLRAGGSSPAAVFDAAFRALPPPFVTDPGVYGAALSAYQAACADGRGKRREDVVRHSIHMAIADEGQR